MIGPITTVEFTNQSRRLTTSFLSVSAVLYVDRSQIKISEINLFYQNFTFCMPSRGAPLDMHQEGARLFMVQVMR